MFAPKYFQNAYFTPKHFAQNGNYSESRFVQLDTLSSVRSLPVVEQKVNYVLIQAQDKDVRYRMDGIVPTATDGLLLYAGDPPSKFDGSIRLLRFIEKEASAKLNIHFF